MTIDRRCHGHCRSSSCALCIGPCAVGRLPIVSRRRSLPAVRYPPRDSGGALRLILTLGQFFRVVPWSSPSNCSSLAFKMFDKITLRKFLPPRRQARKGKSIYVSPNFASFARLRDTFCNREFMDKSQKYLLSTSAASRSGSAAVPGFRSNDSPRGHSVPG